MESTSYVTIVHNVLLLYWQSNPVPTGLYGILLEASPNLRHRAWRTERGVTRPVERPDFTRHKGYQSTESVARHGSLGSRVV
ncbi:hypothetical protein RRG08_029116 [Elysia crispata]|uniref:Uncharacterized protein n=1 Tax=Elysia crispata TaxID=231223 RepID=A0AAE0Y6B9_9GAST|nr:hypothetical protein RRG08_029116 [Elysia crispata]